MDPSVLAILVVAGVAAGFVSALFGLGGGILMVPVMHYALGVPWHQAAAVSLLAIALMTPWAVYQHAARGAVNWRLAVPLAVGGAVGIGIGQLAEPYVPVPHLKLLFAALMLLAAYRMVAGSAHARFHTQSLALLLPLGVVCGVSAKLLGIGGGLISVPVLNLFGTGIHEAVASSLVPVFSNGAVSTAVQFARGADLLWGIPLAVGGLAGIPLGARAAHGLVPVNLKRAFAAALGVAALWIGATSGAF